MGRPRKNPEQAAEPKAEKKMAKKTAEKTVAVTTENAAEKTQKQTTMSAILAAFNGFETAKTAELECKRFMEDLKIAGEDTLRVHRTRKLLEATRELENAQAVLEEKQAELKAVEVTCSPDAITVNFLNALKDCKSKGAKKTFNDALDALNPYTYEVMLMNAQEAVDKAQAEVDKKQEIVDDNKAYIEMIEKTMDRLFNETVEVKEKKK